MGGITIVKPLSEDFDGGLGAVFLFHGHIHVVHKQDELFARRGAKHTFSSLFAFGINQIYWNMIGAFD